MRRDVRTLQKAARKDVVQYQKLIAQSSPASVGANSNVSPTANPPLPMPKMPEIKIPTFSGKFDEWCSFWDLFSSLVHCRTDLTDVVKFSCLRSSLSGTAFKVIEGLPVTNAHYASAVKALKEFYFDESKLQRQIIAEFTNLPCPSHNYSELLSFKLQYEKLLYRFDSLSIDKEAIEPVIRSLICQKLPTETTKILVAKFDTLDFNVKQISTGIKHVCDLLEFCGETNLPKPKVRDHRNTHIAMVSVNKSDVSRKNCTKVKPNHGQYSLKLCLFCEKPHSSRDCQIYDSVDKRRERAKVLRLCFSCLHEGHLSSSCTNKQKCRVCDGFHHTFFCYRVCGKAVNPSKNLSQPQPPAVTTNTLPVTTAQENGTHVESGSVLNAPDSGSVQINQSLDVSSSTISVQSAKALVRQPVQHLTPTALPTASAVISGGGSKSCERVFFDTGAQRSFISSELVDKLNLPVLDVIPLKSTPFGSDTIDYHCKLVKVVVRLGKSRVVVNALVHERVTSHIKTPGLHNVAKYLRKKRIRLADRFINSDVVEDITMVIGVDYFHKFIDSQSICNGIQVFSSTAGALIYGPLPSWSYESQSINAVSVATTFCAKMIVEDYCCDVDRMWDLDSVGIRLESQTPEERGTVEFFHKEVKFEDGKYIVRLPFKGEERPPVNYRMAVGQIQ